jgi:hypothetical protein
MGQGRISFIDDEANRQEVAECFAAGFSRKQMCERFGIKQPRTITAWRRDPRVKAIVTKLVQDRAVEVSRKVDSIIEGRLSQPDGLTVKDLIDIRKEYGGATLQRQQIEDPETVGVAMNALEDDPKLVERLESALAGNDPEPAEAK